MVNSNTFFLYIDVSGKGSIIERPFGGTGSTDVNLTGAETDVDSLTFTFTTEGFLGISLQAVDKNQIVYTTTKPYIINTGVLVRSIN